MSLSWQKKEMAQVHSTYNQYAYCMDRTHPEGTYRKEAIKSLGSRTSQLWPPDGGFQEPHFGRFLVHREGNLIGLNPPYMHHRLKKRKKNDKNMRAVTGMGNVQDDVHIHDKHSRHMCIVSIERRKKGRIDKGMV